MKNTLIINTGGTFNKLYNKINGDLFVPKHSLSIVKILSENDILDVHIEGMIYKDSLDITKEDRIELIKYISLKSSSYSNIIIVHGTDTLNISAKLLEEVGVSTTCNVYFTGAMIPYSFKDTDAEQNLLFTIYETKKHNQNGSVFVSFDDKIGSYSTLVKD